MLLDEKIAAKICEDENIGFWRATTAANPFLSCLDSLCKYEIIKHIKILFKKYFQISFLPPSTLYSAFQLYLARTLFIFHNQVSVVDIYIYLYIIGEINN